MEEPEKLVTITDFIDKNEKTLAVIGVLIALGLFWNSIPEHELVPSIPFWCFLATLPLYWEVVRSVNITKSTWSLVITINLFSPILLNSAYFAFVSFRGEWQNHMGSLVFWVIVFSSWWLINKFKIAEKILEFLLARDKRKRKVVMVRPRDGDTEINPDDLAHAKKLAEIAGEFDERNEKSDDAFRQNVAPLLRILIVLITLLAAAPVQKLIVGAINNRLDAYHDFMIAPQDKDLPAVAGPSESP